MRTLDFKAAAVSVVEVVAKTAERAGILEQKRPPVNRDAAAELARRREINARGDSIRAARERAIFGGQGVRWIEPRPDWLTRR